jgi:plasmid maintenance system killer protein
MSDSPKFLCGAPLIGKPRGHYSFTINNESRICFAWKEDGAYDVEIVETHRERKSGK